MERFAVGKGSRNLGEVPWLTVPLVRFPPVIRMKGAIG